MPVVVALRVIQLYWTVSQYVAQYLTPYSWWWTGCWWSWAWTWAWGEERGEGSGSGSGSGSWEFAAQSQTESDPDESPRRCRRRRLFVRREGGALSAVSSPIECRVVYVESVARVTVLSRSARVLRFLGCLDGLLGQWGELSERYEDITLVPRIL